MSDEKDRMERLAQDATEAALAILSRHGGVLLVNAPASMALFANLAAGKNPQTWANFYAALPRESQRAFRKELIEDIVKIHEARKALLGILEDVKREGSRLVYALLEELFGSIGPAVSV